ncbi:nickel-dependent lactate racemase [Candidatus Fermentibacteria bacterium]|nr:nickel-dependent lactate racemase [Candidatus Fermentibacteria bacterium]
MAEGELTELEVPYGRDTTMVRLPSSNVLATVHPNEVEKTDAGVALREALENPVSSPSFSDFLSGGGSTLVIVNDGTRPTPTSKVLDHLFDMIPPETAADLEFLMATGIHRAPTEEELGFIFGRHLEGLRDRIHVHDAEKDEMVHLGTSSNGTEMYLNKMGVEADRLVIIGSVEPHYFAGYTGGRKSFLPGIASYRTIEQNHKYALLPEAKALALQGNPVHEDMIDALKAVTEKPIFSIQTVLDRERDIYAATAGHIHESFYAAIDKAKEVFCVEVPRKAEIVVSVAPYPMDVDLYQSQKAIDNAKLALKENGILVLAATCRTGIGHETFYELLSSCDSPQEAIDTIDKGYVLGYHKAAKMAEIGLWADMWAVTELPDDMVRNVLMEPFENLQTAVDAALQLKGPDAGVLFLMEGSITVPIVE